MQSKNEDYSATVEEFLKKAQRLFEILPKMLQDNYSKQTWGLEKKEAILGNCILSFNKILQKENPSFKLDLSIRDDKEIPRMIGEKKAKSAFLSSFNVGVNDKEAFKNPNMALLDSQMTAALIRLRNLTKDWLQEIAYDRKDIPWDKFDETWDSFFKNFVTVPVVPKKDDLEAFDQIEEFDKIEELEHTRKPPHSFFHHRKHEKLANIIEEDELEDVSANALENIPKERERKHTPVKGKGSMQVIPEVTQTQEDMKVTQSTIPTERETFREKPRGFKK